jgi:hypothetical protein
MRARRIRLLLEEEEEEEEAGEPQHGNGATALAVPVGRFRGGKTIAVPMAEARGIPRTLRLQRPSGVRWRKMHEYIQVAPVSLQKYPIS